MSNVIPYTPKELNTPTHNFSKVVENVRKTIGDRLRDPGPSARQLMDWGAFQGVDPKELHTTKNLNDLVEGIVQDVMVKMYPRDQEHWEYQAEKERRLIERKARAGRVSTGR